MRECLKFYIDGQWVDPAELKTANAVNPATEQVSGTIALGSTADVDKAVKAARKAFAGWSRTTREERLKVLSRILEEYQKRSGDLAAAITEEMGAPKGLAGGFQVGLGAGHLNTAIEVLKKTEQDVIPRIENAEDRRELEELCRAVRQAMGSGDKKKMEDASSLLNDRLLNYAYLL